MTKRSPTKDVRWNSELVNAVIRTLLDLSPTQKQLITYFCPTFSTGQIKGIMKRLVDIGAVDVVNYGKGRRYELNAEWMQDRHGQHWQQWDWFNNGPDKEVLHESRLSRVTYTRGAYICELGNYDTNIGDIVYEEVDEEQLPRSTRAILIAHRKGLGDNDHASTDDKRRA